MAKHWHAARAARERLRAAEGEAQQAFLAVVARLFGERRLSCHAYLARKPAASAYNAPLAGYGAFILYCRDTFAALVLITRRSDDWPARPDLIAQHSGSTDSGSDVDSCRQEI